MKRISKTVILFITVLSLWVLQGSVLAEESKTEEEDGILELESVTVTANKREEDIRTVPASITAFSETDIEDAGIEDMNDAILLVPGMDSQPDPYGQKINFRGMSPSKFSYRNPVVFYIDGVPYDPSLSLSIIDLQNVERIEVLRGPQGTLYGKNTIGGVINIVTRKPGDTFQGMVSGEVGQFGGTGLKASVSAPVVDDQLYFGFSASSSKSDGFLKNTHPDEDYVDDDLQNTAKAFLRFTPNEKLDIDLIVGVTQKEAGGGTMVPGYDITYEAYRNPDDEYSSDTNSIALSLGYQFTDFDLKSVITQRTATSTGIYDFGAFNSSYGNSIGDDVTTNQSLELRIQSPEGAEGIEWLAGLFISADEADYKEQSWVYNTTSYYGYDIKYDWPTTTRENSQALFGQLTIPLSKTFDFTTGLRYETTHKEMDYEYSVTNASTGTVLAMDPFTGSPAEVSYEIEDDWSVVLPKAVLSYKFNSESMIYAGISDGYLAGGFNITENDKDEATFDPQTSRNYEIGTKLPFWNGRAFLDAVAFYIDINDMHVWSQVGPTTFKASNAGKSHSQGFELQASAQATDTLKLSFAYSQTEARYDEYENQGVDYKGKTVARTPENKATLGLSYRNGSGIFARADMVRIGKTYFDEANTVIRDPYTLINAKAGYETDDWDVYLQVKNLADTEYAESYITSLGAAMVGAPRTVSLIASKRF